MKMRVDRRVGERPEKGERYYIVFEDMSRADVETFLALVDTVHKEVEDLLPFITEQSWAKVLHVIEEVDGAPAWRLPSSSTLEDAEQAMEGLRAQYAYAMAIDPNILKMLGQRSDGQN